MKSQLQCFHLHAESSAQGKSNVRIWGVKQNVDCLGSYRHQCMLHLGPSSRSHSMEDGYKVTICVGGNVTKCTKVCTMLQSVPESVQCCTTCTKVCVALLLVCCYVRNCTQFSFQLWNVNKRNKVIHKHFYLEQSKWRWIKISQGKYEYKHCFHQIAGGRMLCLHQCPLLPVVQISTTSPGLNTRDCPQDNLSLKEWSKTMYTSRLIWDIPKTVYIVLGISQTDLEV